MADAASESVKKSTSATRKLADALGITEKQAKTALKAIQDMGLAGAKSADRIVKPLKDAKPAISDLKSSIRDMTAKLNKLNFEKKMNPKNAVEMNKKFEEIKNTLQDIEKGHTFEQQQEVVESLTKEVKGLGRGLENIEEASKFKLDFGKPQTFKAVFNEISRSPDILSAMGTAAKGLGGSLGGVTKMFAGWPGAILMGVKAIWDMGMAADQFVKDANKAFLRMRGPDIMTGDVQKQFKEFNNQIYMTGENIRVGLNANDIRGFLEATTQAGLNITTLNKGLTTYRDAIYVASKASKTLGMDLPQVGAIMGKLLTDFGMDMAKVDDTFVQVAFDAKKSGLSTDRFWNTVQNASASLALYGVAVGAASKTMKTFTEDAVGGADDASQATEDMFKIFKDGSIGAQAAFLSFAKAGGASVKNEFSRRAEESGKQVIALEKAVEKASKKPEDVEVLKKLRKQLAKARSDQKRFEKVVKVGDVEQVTEIGALADKASVFTAAAVRGAMGVSDLTKVSSQTMLASRASMQKLGVSEKSMVELVTQAKQAREYLDGLYGTTENAFISGKGKIADSLKSLLVNSDGTNTNEEDQIATSEDIANQLFASGEMDEDQAKTWAKLVGSSVTYNAQSGKNESKMVDLLTSGNFNKSQFDALLKSSGTLNKFIDSGFTMQDKTQGEMKDNAEDTFEKIVDQTLSFKDMQGIAKDEVTWRADSLGFLQTMNRGVFDIFKWLTKDDKKYQSESQKLAQEDVKTAVAQDATLKGLLKLDKGQITKKSQTALTKALVTKVDTLSDNLEAGQKTAGILSAAGTAPDSTKAIKKAIEKLQKVDAKGDQKLIKKNKEVITRLQRALENGIDKESKENDEQVKRDGKDLTTAQESLTNLKSLDKNNETIAKIQNLLLKTSPEAMKNISDEIQKRLAGGEKLPDIMSDLEISSGDLQDVLKKTGENKIIQGALDEANKRGADLPDIPLFRALGLKPKKLAGGGIVTGPTNALIGERGPEAVVPLGKGAGGAGKNITITINANEKDLAQRIANEIRSILYKEQIG